MKEKWVRINQIEGYENVRDCYWISNADEDKIMNRDSGKIKKIGINNQGYKRVGLRTKDGKVRTCKIHVIKAKAFIFGPNPLGYNVVRHLNDIRTDNRLENLAFGTQSDNNLDCIRNGNFNYEAASRSGKINGKINGIKNFAKSVKKPKPVKCLETGIIFESIIEASRQTKISLSHISECCLGKRKTSGGFHWEFINKDDIN